MGKQKDIRYFTPAEIREAQRRLQAEFRRQLFWKKVLAGCGILIIVALIAALITLVGRG